MARSIRDIIQIDEDLCDGCGDCITACAEGALEIVDGKARLKDDILCDGAGACIGHCPTGALTIIQRDAGEYDEVAVEKELATQKKAPQPLTQVQHGMSGGCPGSAMRQWDRKPPQACPVPPTTPGAGLSDSQLRQWPVQLMLVPPNAPFLAQSDLVICADCVPFAYAGFHRDFLRGRALVVGCPKLDNLQFYLDKLTDMFAQSKPKSVEVLLMQVPCCSGLGQAVQMARRQADGEFPVRVTTIGIQGDVLESVEL